MILAHRVIEPTARWFGREELADTYRERFKSLICSKEYADEGCLGRDRAGQAGGNGLIRCPKRQPRACGIEKNGGPHTARHAFATILRGNGFRLEDIQLILFTQQQSHDRSLRQTHLNARDTRPLAPALEGGRIQTIN